MDRLPSQDGVHRGSIKTGHLLNLIAANATFALLDSYESGARDPNLLGEVALPQTTSLPDRPEAPTDFWIRQ